MSVSSYRDYEKGGILKDRYKKIKDITEGAYGLVSVARDLHTSKLVAVKYVYQAEEMNERSREPAVNDDDDCGSSNSPVQKMTNGVCQEAIYEIEIHRKIGFHPYIVSLNDYFDSFIILEYCSRGDLYEAIKSNTGPQSTRDIVNVVLQLIDAVAFVHSKSIYHRDIKPENILIADDWSIRLSDWGLATTERFSKDFGVGSERYMAPELFDETNIKSYDASKCDIWSIGICLLNIVFHKNPFSAANQTDKSFSYFACNREALFDIFSTMSNDLFTVLRYSLTIDPENRDLSKLKEELLKVQSLTLDDYVPQSKDDLDIEESKVIPIKIGSTDGSGRTAGNHHKKKSFAIPTPNTHINNHFHDFKQKAFNRKDFFTPPSVSAHYMDHYDYKKRAKQTVLQQIPNSSDRSENSRKNSAGKYVPPNLRQANVNKSPLHHYTSTNEHLDTDDEMFILENGDNNSPPIIFEDDIGELDEQIAHVDLNYKGYLSDNSSTPSLLAPAPLLKSRVHGISSTVDDRSTPKRGRDTNKSSGSNSSSERTSSNWRKYVPPHQRENWKSRNSQQSTSRRFTNHSSSHPIVKKDDYFSNSVPTRSTDWFQHSRIDDMDEDPFDDDFENSEMYYKFAKRVGERSYNVSSSNNLKKESQSRPGEQIYETTREIPSSAV